jgi:hypothetical protein
MSDSKQQANRVVESSSSEGRTNQTEYVERSDVGVSLTVKLTRGTGTRDQDKIVAKAKGKTLKDAREDMEILREYIHDLAEDAARSNPRKKMSSGRAVFRRLSSGGGDHQ